jgi:endonuclease/exonuclease/phosphatase family metal-dependent hydrolase
MPNAAARSAAPPRGDAMRVVSWNIHGGVGRDGQRDLDRVARVLTKARCDVAALQEVGDPHRAVRGEDRRHEVADHAAYLARLLGWYVAFGPTLVHAGRPYGNAVLSRYPILGGRNYDLSVRGREPRGCLRADLQVDGGVVHLFNLHLGLSGGERRRQAGMLLSADLLRDAALTAPMLVCGDFNMWFPVPGPIARLLRRSLRDAAWLVGGRRATWPARLPILRLDRAYVDAGIEVLACGVLDDGEAREASDHLPLWLDLLPRQSLADAEQASAVAQ